jgi:hypothetical protein
MNLFHQIAFNIIQKKIDELENNSNLSIYIYKFFFDFFSQKKYTIHEKYAFLNKTCANIFLTESMKDDFFQLFQDIQKKYLTLQRFIFIVKYKSSKIVVTTDLCLNPITETNKNVIGIYQNHRRYLFDIRELIKLVNKALIHSEYFFASPLVTKNPYNNIILNKSTLYNIYFFMRFKTLYFSQVIHHFFLCNFHLFNFRESNENLLRNQTLYDFINNESSRQLNLYFDEMIIEYNSLCPNTKINIDDDFPVEKLVFIMKPYINLYLLSKYSLSYQDKVYFKKEYIRKLVRFYKFNPRFGRKIIKINYQDQNKIMCKKQIKNKETTFIENHVFFYEDKNDDFLNSHKIKDNKFVFEDVIIIDNEDDE